MIEIRLANESDLDWLVGELRELDRMYPTRKRLFKDEPTVREKLSELITTDVCLVAENKGITPPQRIGFIAGFLRPHSFNPDLKVLSELFWVVIPEFRRSLTASMLMDEFVEIGRLNADWITFNVARFCPVRKDSFVRRGFDVSDQVYLMEV